MIRMYHPNDLMDVARIWDEFYSSEFEMPNFESFVQAFTIVNEDQIILVGGVRTILEAIILTDKKATPKIKRESLIQMFQALSFTANQTGYDQIHASIINDEKWKKHLMKVGFKKTKGEMLVLT